jgi:MPBQ/MSBQ methyltransferase
MSASFATEAQYSRGDLRARITGALQAAGENLDRLSINDLALIDEFHLLGRAATMELAVSPPSTA